jgi:hypothetical protein
MENFEKITAKLLLDEIYKARKQKENLEILKYDASRYYAKIAQCYYIAAKLYNIQKGLDIKNDIAHEYDLIENELNLIINS